MSSARFPLSVLTAIVLACAALPLLGQNPLPAPPAPGANPAPTPAEIRQEQPAFYVRAEVDHPSRHYREGETLSLKITCEADAYLYVLYQQADGQVFQIFPNSGQPENRVKGKELLQIPAADDLFRWQIGAPFGKEAIKVLASKKPLPELADPELRRQRFNPVPTEAIAGVKQALATDVPAKDWGEVDIDITTHDLNESAPKSVARRFGVFFGASEYEFNAEMAAASRDKRGLNLATPVTDVRTVSDLMRQQGKLDEVRVYTNAQYTRAAMQRVLTDWLPKVSSEGDTIVVYVSGRGSAMPDDNGDEADGWDELLLPHDFLKFDVLHALWLRLAQGRLDPSLKPRVTALVARLESAGIKFGPEMTEKDQDEAELLVWRWTSISDDLFGRWLQALSGRQVVVILDAAMAQGFADGKRTPTTTKGIEPPRTFDFLDREMSRLKDIGQTNQALLAASYPSQFPLEQVAERDLSLLTYYLTACLERDTGTVNLKRAYADCDAGMKRYFASQDFQAINRRLEGLGQQPLSPFAPILVDYCEPDVVLKP